MNRSISMLSVVQEIFAKVLLDSVMNSSEIEKKKRFALSNAISKGQNVVADNLCSIKQLSD